MPYLAACFTLHYFSMSVYEDFYRLLTGRMTGSLTSDELADLGMEIHGVSSAGKPLASWTAQRAVQEAREACGGHGYLTAARLGKIREDNDANCTYEGDNNVLLQQTSNWILKAYTSSDSKPTGVLHWIKDLDEKCPLSNHLDSDFALLATRRLTLALIGSTLQKLDSMDKGCDKFLARGNSQFHYARTLALVFVHSLVIQRFIEFVASNPEFAVLRHISDLYALWVVEEFGSDMVIHRVLDGNCLQRIRDKVIILSRNLVKESVALTDVLAPPDFILDSILGHSSGRVYELMEQSFMSVPNGFQVADFAELYTRNYRSKL